MFAPRSSLRILSGSVVIMGAMLGHIAAQAQSITTTQNLVFGAFIPTSGGTIVVSTAGARSATGGVVLLTNTQFPAPTAARFSVVNNAPRAKTFTVTLPASATLARTGGGATMTVNAFTSNPIAGQGTGNKGFGTLTAGAAEILVGATLNVNSAQAVGNYTGTFAVTVAFP